MCEVVHSDSAFGRMVDRKKLKETIAAELPSLDIHSIDFQLGMMTMAALNVQSLRDYYRNRRLMKDANTPWILMSLDEIEKHPSKIFIRVPIGLHCDIYEGGEGLAFYMRLNKDDINDFTCIRIRASGVTAFECPPPQPPLIPIGSDVEDRTKLSAYADDIKTIKERWSRRGAILLSNLIMHDIVYVRNRGHISVQTKGTLKAVCIHIQSFGVGGGGGDIKELGNEPFNTFLNCIQSGNSSHRPKFIQNNKSEEPTDDLTYFINKNILEIMDVKRYLGIGGIKLHTYKRGGGVVLGYKRI